MLIKLTEHFTLDEMLVSGTAARLGIKNTPNPNQITALKNTCMGLEPIRTVTGYPIVVISGFRSKELNFAVGGAPNSQHMYGEAADIICPGYGSAYKLAKLICINVVPFRVDQLVYEYRQWVHVSFSLYEKPRNEVFSIFNRRDGYVRGLFT